jgi:hypothetical protein
MLSNILLKNILPFPVYDILNYQFMLYTNFTEDVIDFLNNNNLNINYYCFYKIKNENLIYIITSNTIKRIDNGYRIITIEFIESNNNYVHILNDFFIVQYENIKIKISKMYDILDLNTTLANKNLSISVADINTEISNNNTTLDMNMILNKNIDTTKVIKLINLSSISIISSLDFPILQRIECGRYCSFYNSCKMPSSLKTLVIKKFLPNRDFNTMSNVDNFFDPPLILTYQKYLHANALLSLEELDLEGNFNGLSEWFLPSNLKYLKYLKLGNAFNHSVNWFLFSNLERLEFGDKFNQRIMSLPLNLKYLKLGNNFNILIGVNTLPKSLKHLILGHNYNHPIRNNVLPPALETLTLPKKYKQNICITAIPLTLIIINCYQPFYNKTKLPKSILHLIQNI